MITFWSAVAFFILNALLWLTAIGYSLYNIYMSYGIEMLVIGIAGIMFLMTMLVAAIVQLVRIIKRKIDRIKNMSLKEIIQLVISIIKR